VTTTAVSLTSARRSLRRELWARRAAQPLTARRAAARLICAHLARAPWFRPGIAVGLYLARDSEVDTAALLALARRRGCRVYLPRITDYAAHRMQLARDGGARRTLNRYRIAEPRGAATLPAQALALVLMPLVGFDRAGNRLGNGAGYYDRFVANRRGRGGRPLLIGIAFECQRLEAIPAAAHDVPLDGVITERGLHYFQRRS
jgi:5-formyltetrahydrofolate cyclo-ligase